MLCFRIHYCSVNFLASLMLSFMEGVDIKMVLAGRMLLFPLRICSNLINFIYFCFFFTQFFENF